MNPSHPLAMMVASVLPGDAAVIVAWALIAVAVIRVVTTPADRWAHRRWSKTALIALALWGNLTIAAIPLPVGPVLVAVAAGRRARRGPVDDGWTRPSPITPAAGNTTEEAS